MYIRSVTESDLTSLYKLVERAPAGLTSLPRDQKILHEKIMQSVESEQAASGQEWQRILLVLFDPVEQCITGVSGLEREKSTAPHYTVDNKLERLRLDTTAISPVKLGSLLLGDTHRRRGFGGLLSKSRFLYLASLPEELSEYIHAELRGWVNNDDASPFWETLGYSLYGDNFSAIDHFRGSQPDAFAFHHLAAHEVPFSLLNQEVLAKMGQVHPDTKNALRMLEQENFGRTCHVDILDGGPIVRATTAEIATIRNSVICPVTEVSTNDLLSDRWMISNSQSKAFRACLHPAALREGMLHVHSQTLSTLKIQPGERVRAILKQSSKQGNIHD
ncbi:hypothetical protein A6M27_10025 [Acidithiobacillus thiooxidans]|uniref:Arginine N-succinyltransferase n=1 Tax=Acidithiobacillus thiooxidans TaxID=930 RepID=A0A1C2IEJ6_ACITH|nr:arginine N-succinyltransferase [Acidithiobacillus thiooxidans]OCX71669.1 hypothetical protein A6P07_11320 [Acidithiobacillus thiooxidans]OCX74237.1 hypothetical protein A6M23_06635 [Acidithiobacillus thiooxidans]OCX74415.1 hypothetical protein A6O24_10600 [Acidithiobacillus thiooxidans]OCX77773.1 hypothetical protein A6O26_19080 [Acidithiobacillus thiooxidans]OCX87736.1 hypothetical protein A6P08_01495 [Acidithiobacillus thiooxidans]